MGRWTGGETYGIEIELVLGQLDDVVGDLLVFGQRLGGQSIDIIDGVLPARRGLWGCQGCHRGIGRELKIQVVESSSGGGSKVLVSRRDLSDRPDIATCIS